MVTQSEVYAATLDIDYPERLDRLTSFFRLFWVIPIGIVLGFLSAQATSTVTVINTSGQVVSTVSRSGGGIVGGLFAATLLMILFRQRYPRWWFDFALEFTRFSNRVGAYVALLTDTYPSTVEEQSVHIEVDYPDDVPQNLNRWLPLVKWFLAIPHYIVLAFLFIGAFFAVSSPGSPSCSPAATHAGCSTTWSELADGHCGSRPTQPCWSPTDTRRSACAEQARRRRHRIGNCHEARSGLTPRPATGRTCGEQPDGTGPTRHRPRSTSRPPCERRAPPRADRPRPRRAPRAPR